MQAMSPLSPSFLLKNSMLSYRCHDLLMRVARQDIATIGAEARALRWTGQRAPAGG